MSKCAPGPWIFSAPFVYEGAVSDVLSALRNQLNQFLSHFYKVYCTVRLCSCPYFQFYSPNGLFIFNPEKSSVAQPNVFENFDSEFDINDAAYNA